MLRIGLLEVKIKRILIKHKSSMKIHPQFTLNSYSQPILILQGGNKNPTWIRHAEIKIRKDVFNMSKKMVALGLGVVLTAMSFGTVLANENTELLEEQQAVEVREFGLGFKGGQFSGEARGEQLCLDEERMQQLAEEAGMPVEEFIEQLQAERTAFREQRQQERAEFRENRQGQFGGQKGNRQQMMLHNNL